MLMTVESVVTSYVPLGILVLFVLFYFVKLTRLFLRWRARLKKTEIALRAFPGPPTHWLFGNLHQIPGFNRKAMEWFRPWVRKYPKGLTIWIGPFRPLLILYHPETCKAVLRSTEPKQVSGLGGYSLIKPWLGDGLLLSSGPKWFRNRRLLTPAFHFDVLQPYMEIYNKASDIFLTKFTSERTGGRSVEVFKPVSLCTLDVILKCAFSSDMNVQTQGENNPYVNAVNRIAHLTMKRTLNPLIYPPMIYNLTRAGREYNRLLKLTHDVSTNQNTNEKKRYPDFLDILLLAKDDDDKGLTDIEIRDEVDTFLFEGHDTTASAISWAIYALAEYPQEQHKCFEEVAKVFSGRNTDEMFWDDLNHLPYLTLCIKESMRMHAPVPTIGREVQDELVVDGVTIPAGTNIQMSLNGMHHNEDVWGDDHEIFKPERFETDKAANMDSFQFVPFSAGPRNCIGQNFAMHEIKVVLSKLILRYQMTIDPEHIPSPTSEIVTRSENGLHVFFRERQ